MTDATLTRHRTLTVTAATCNRCGQLVDADDLERDRWGAGHVCRSLRDCLRRKKHAHVRGGAKR